MLSPFVGMDPYLEDANIFPDLHDSLIVFLKEALNERLPAPYYAGITSRVWIEAGQHLVGPDVQLLKPRRGSRNGSPGPRSAPQTEGGVATEPLVISVFQDEIRETILEVYSRDKSDRLVTHIEVLSLSNKTPRDRGRKKYLRKQQEVLHSKVHLVEIDLLRGGKHTTAVPRNLVEAQVGPFDYHVCVRRFNKPDEFLVYIRRLGERLPQVRIPLLPREGEIEVDIQALLDRCYDTGKYDRRIRYAGKPPLPPLRPSN